MRQAFTTLQMYNQSAIAGISRVAATPNAAMFLRKCLSSIGAPISGSALTVAVNERIVDFGLQPIADTSRKPSPAIAAPAQIDIAEHTNHLKM